MEPTMRQTNGHAILSLQQEKIRLEKANNASQEKVQRMQRFIDMLADLYWAAQRITQEEYLLRTFDLLHYRTLETSQVTDGSILVLDEATDELVFWVVQGSLSRQLTGTRIPANKGVAGWVMQTGQEVIIDNAYQDERFSAEVDASQSFVTCSMLCVPILAGNKRLGVIQLLNKQTNFDETDLVLVKVLSDVIAQGLAELELHTLEQPFQPAMKYIDYLDEVYGGLASTIPTTMINQEASCYYAGIV